MNEPKPCPFCGTPVNWIKGQLFGWHDAECFFQLLEDGEVNMTQEEIEEAFIKAWNRRANNGQ